MAEENKKPSNAGNAVRAGLLAAGLAALVGGSNGCMVTPGDVERFANTGSFIERAEENRDWVEIDGKMGFINFQGYGIIRAQVPRGYSERFHVYRRVGGEWVGVNAKTVDPRNSYEVEF